MAEMSVACPCCGQSMPKTDFALWPKSAAVFRDGRVFLLGAVQFRLLQQLWAAYPTSLTIDELLDDVYNGTKNYEAHRKNISASMHYLRIKLARLNVEVPCVWNAYSLRIK